AGVHGNRLYQFAARLLFALLPQLGGALHALPENRNKNRSADQRKHQQRGKPEFPSSACGFYRGIHHGSAPPVLAVTYRGLKAATPRAIASATPGAMWSRSARSFTSTLETSTAIAGAAVVRSWRMVAVCAASGEPLNCCVSIPCTKSPSFRLSPR